MPNSETDTGKHYRFEYKGIKLDPARILLIYNALHPCQGYILKKVLAPGTRGKKTVVEDILDIRNACDRWLEMIAEDEEDNNE